MQVELSLVGTRPVRVEKIKINSWIFSRPADTDRPGEVRLVLPRAVLAPPRSQARIDTGLESGHRPGSINIPKVRQCLKSQLKYLVLKQPCHLCERIIRHEDYFHASLERQLLL